jgi:diacylglycerol O-acyltransferase / trehalose O-mycolyltransferase
MGTGRHAVAALAAALLLGAATGCSSAHPVKPNRPPGRIVQTTVISARERDLTITSSAVPGRVPVRLLLPADYTTQPARRWPVLMLLHGCCDTYISWTRSTDLEDLSASTPALIVMPAGGAVGFYSNWRKGPQWETFHLDVLLPLLAKYYRAGEVRAVAGLSMGGLGALDYAARHPGMFRAAASFSGVVDPRLDTSTESLYESLVAGTGAGPEDLWGNPTSDASEWAAHNPTDLAPKLRGTALFLSVGNGKPGPFDDGARSPGEARLYQQNLALRDRLRQLHIPFRGDFYGPGTHTWPYWQRELHRAWPMLIQALGLG